MKKIVFLGSLLLCMNAHAEQIHSYNDVVRAIENGKLIRIFVDYAKCNTIGQQILIPFGGAYTPNEIGINYAAGHVAAALTHFTTNNPKFPNKPINEFLRYTIQSNGDVNLDMTPFSATDYSQLDEKFSVVCKLDQSVKIFV